MTVPRNEAGRPWNELARLDGLTSVLDPADARGGKNRLIHRVHLRALSKALGPVRGERALDFGCGTGRISSWLVRNRATVEGVDATAEMVDVARANVSGAAFHVIDGSSLPFEPERFDVVISVYVLQYYVTRDEHILRELTRVLRSGGRLVAIEQVTDSDIGRGASSAEYRRSFEAAGLQVVRIDPVRRFDSRVVHVGQRFPLLSHLPGLASLAMREARSVDMSALTGGSYVDALICTRKP
ncbi:MAG TPA: class I SAM-dependent methyltransferase [Gaiellaceae bacterium]|nr:class I SAM-dependent methyltransferase [Gaiellaceae bacterium]